MNKELIYGITESPKTLKEWIFYSMQQTLSILTATILISNLCGTDIAAGMVGAGVATIAFQIFTHFKAPLFFSNSGSTVAAVITALTIFPDSYTGVILGGLVACVMNVIAGLLVKSIGSGWVNKLLPPALAGTVVCVIGLNLAGFCVTYIGTGGDYSLLKILVAFISMLTTVLVMRYGKGLWKTLPFLCGALVGYILAAILGLVDFSIFTNTPLFIKPDFAFLHFSLTEIEWSKVLTIVITFAAVNLANMAEHISDVLAVSSVVGEDLTKTVGIDKTLIGDGIADLIGSIIGGQPTTTYSESLSTIEVSRVASTRIIACAAALLIALGFFGPFNAFVSSIPSCVFGGIAIVAYGCIAFAGIRVMVNANPTSRKNSIIIPVMLVLGVSGISVNIGHFSLTTIVLSMIIGLLLNLIIKE